MEDLYNLFDSFFGEWLDDTDIEAVLLVDNLGIVKRKISRIPFDKDDVISSIESSLFRPTLLGLNEPTSNAIEIFIKSTRGYILFYRLSEELFLAVISGSHCKLGLLQILVHTFVNKAKEIFLKEFHL